jgi:methylated-DNA-[protein]-cysteine S-methyltransferase
VIAPAPAATLAGSTIDTPIGRLGLLAGEAGLVKVTFAHEAFGEVAERLSARLGARLVQRPERLDQVKRQLDEYFTGRRRDFDLKLDLSLIAGFALAVAGRLRAIPYGATLTYGQVALSLGRPGAARAVGRACGANPAPVVVPCHRVVAADGRLGGFGGGLDIKSALLTLEGVTCR